MIPERRASGARALLDGDGDARPTLSLLMSDWRYPRIKQPERADPCDGCHACGSRCTAGIEMARDEFDRIVEYLRTLEPRQALRVLNEDKTWTWSEDARVHACHFYDMRQQRGGAAGGLPPFHCIVYPVRPLVCRLFGRVEWFPCPIGRPVPQLRGARELMQTYTQQRRATFPEWCSEMGVFDFGQLLAPGG